VKEFLKQEMLDLAVEFEIVSKKQFLVLGYGETKLGQDEML
jgi:hypothetical protein